MRPRSPVTGRAGRCCASARVSAWRRRWRRSPAGASEERARGQRRAARRARVARAPTGRAGPSVCARGPRRRRRCRADGRPGDRHRPWLPPLAVHPPLGGPARRRGRPARRSRSPGPAALAVGSLGRPPAVHRRGRGGGASALSTTVLAATATVPPSELHVYVVDGGGLPEELGDLPHVGAVIARTDDERVARLVDRLATRLDGRPAERRRRRSSSSSTVLPAWRQVVAERLGGEVADRLDRVLVEGPAAGVVVAATVERPGALPLAVSGAVSERLVFRLGDPADALVVGLRPAAVAGPAERSGRRWPAAASTCRSARSRTWRVRSPGVAAAWRTPTPARGRRRPIDRLPEHVAVGTCPSQVVERLTLEAGGPASLVAADRTRRSDPRRLPGWTCTRASTCSWPGLLGPAARRRSSLLASAGPRRRSGGPRRHGHPAPLAPPRADWPEHVTTADELAAGSRHRHAVGAGDAPRTRAPRGRRRAGRRPELDAAPLGQRWVLRAHRGRRRPGRRAALGLWPLDAGAAPAAARALAAAHVRPRRRRARGVLPRRESVAAAPGRGYLVVDGGCALVQLAWPDRAANGSGRLGSPWWGGPTIRGGFARSERATAGPPERGSVPRGQGLLRVPRQHLPITGRRGRHGPARRRRRPVPT